MYMLGFSIHTGYRSSVYVMVVKYGRREEFEFLWEKYLIETEMVEKERLLQGLAGTQNPKLMRRYGFESSVLWW